MKTIVLEIVGALALATSASAFAATPVQSGEGSPALNFVAYYHGHHGYHHHGYRHHGFHHRGYGHHGYYGHRHHRHGLLHRLFR